MCNRSAEMPKGFEQPDLPTSDRSPKTEALSAKRKNADLDKLMIFRHPANRFEDTPPLSG